MKLKLHLGNSCYIIWITAEIITSTAKIHSNPFYEYMTMNFQMLSLLLRYGLSGLWSPYSDSFYTNKVISSKMGSTVMVKMAGINMIAMMNCESAILKLNFSLFKGYCLTRLSFIAWEITSKS